MNGSTMSNVRPPDGVTVSCERPFLTVRLSGLHRTLSWSLSHPGFASVETITWLEVCNADLGPDVDPHDFLCRKLAENSLSGSLAMMTSRDIRHHHSDRAKVDGVEAFCLTTVGLSNGERVGSRLGRQSGAGTVNTLVRVSQPLSSGALVEAVSIATQARTMAILEAGYPEGGPFFTGTGTDCIVVAAPLEGKVRAFAGLHTDVGEAIGAAVYRATREGVQMWKLDYTSDRKSVV